MARRTPWGRLPGQTVDVSTPWSFADLAWPRAGGTTLAFGRGRSYGDCALGADGIGIETRRLDRLVAFDRTAGTVECEAGLTLASLLDVIVPAGWTLPVMPGTLEVSVGGALANDVHGKNHERAGTFGRHVLAFELLRSDGSCTWCVPGMPLFELTVGGLGLTGIVTRARLALAPLPSPYVDADTQAFHGVDEFVALSDAAHATHEFSVGWFDAYSWRDGRLRGVLQRANYAAPDVARVAPRSAARRLPLGLASPALTPWAIRRFNDLYHWSQTRPGTQHVDFRRYLFPLDALADWNRLYGARGFFQLQCALPMEALAGLDVLLARIAAAREGSFLAVLKRFGTLRSPSPMSFPLPGVTLALDFRNRGVSTARLLADAAAIVAEHGGRIYAAKDATMPGALFRAAYPAWTALEAARDPRLQSRFWQRVTG
ncbi:MAG: FAD-binding oxidoreductase [Proteobacteria bacterium]|nr:FAD-binding oxidoreductase [Pseudomonadota bacterium]